MKSHIYATKIGSIMVILLLLPLLAYADPGNSQLGVYLQEFNDDLRSRFNYTDNGVIIVGVIHGTGAEKAGLAEEDIIAEINGEKINSTQDIRTIIGQAKPGDEIDVKIIRKGKLKKIPVYLTVEKQEDPPYPRKWIYYSRDNRPWMGIQMQDLNPQLAEYFNVESGVLITEISEKSPAENASLKAGDIITGWDGKEIQDIKDLIKQLRKSDPNDEIQLSFVRNGKQKKTGIVLAEPKEEDNLFSFHMGTDNDDNSIFYLRRPETDRPWADRFPFPGFQDPERRELEENLIPRMDALEKEMESIKKKLEQLLEKSN